MQTKFILHVCCDANNTSTWSFEMAGGSSTAEFHQDKIL